jgi:putative hydrolase of the HAD superfamily
VTHRHPKAILFDLDDTILDYDSVADRSWKQVCDTVSPKLPGLGTQELCAALKAKAQWFWSNPDRHLRGRRDLLAARIEIVSSVLQCLGVSDPEICEEISVAYEKIRTELIAPRPGAIETLRQLHRDGIKLGLVTNGAKEPQRAKIDRFGLEPLFDSIAIEGEFGIGKPDRSVYEHSMKKLGVNPRQTWMIGDNLYFDVGAAQELGIWGIWVDWRRSGLSKDSKVKPDRIVHLISDLVDPAQGE